MNSLDPILTKVLWNRLISIVDEAAKGLVRTAYSVVLREFHDYCVGIFDIEGNMLVHSTDSVPGFIGVMPVVMKNFLREHPAQTLAEGDVLVTNDPWLATGHLLDISTASPIFNEGRLIGFAVCVVHHLDMGGRIACVDSRDMYEEGLKIPIVKLYDRGRRNDTVHAFLRANVRISHKVLGDLNAQIVANNICAAGVNKMIRAYGFSDLRLLATTIIGLAEKSMRRQIRALPNGIYRNAIKLPPIGHMMQPIDIVVAIEVRDEDIVIDYAGSSHAVELALNVTLPMTASYSGYPIKVALDPSVPNNAGCLAPIQVKAPLGSVLNCQPPTPTWGRTIVAHNLPEVVLGALADAIPERVVGASGSTPMSAMYLNGRKASGEEFLLMMSHMGGFGGSLYHDGYGCLAFPYNSATIPIELAEIETCMLYEKKELAVDTAGPGKHRGGFGQEVVMIVPKGRHAPMHPVTSSIRGASRSPDSLYPVFGRQGGLPGRGDHLSLNGKVLPYYGSIKLNAGDTVRLVVPGGGGYGDPFERDVELVRDDVIAGLVSADAARADYGVVIEGPEHRIDHAATAALRSRGKLSAAA